MATASEHVAQVPHAFIGILDGVVGFFDVLIGDVGPHPGDLALAAQLFESRPLGDQPGLEGFGHGVGVLAGQVAHFILIRPPDCIELKVQVIRDSPKGGHGHDGQQLVINGP